MKRSIELYLRFFRQYFCKSKAPWKSPFLITKGIFPEKLNLYPLADFPSSLFLTDWEVETRFPEVNPDSVKDILRCKKTTAELLGQKLCPQVVGFVTGGRVRLLTGRSIKAGEPLFVKPTHGASGRGVSSVNGLDEVSRASDAIIERCLGNSYPVNYIAPAALNTMRIMVARDEDGIFIIGAAHKFATSDTGLVDNFAAGGIVASLCPEKGILGYGVLRGKAGEVSRIEKHPDSGVNFKGLKIPDWPKVLEVVFKATVLVPELRLVGWDVAITDEGPVIIEGNGVTPNPNLIQAHTPLLTNRRVVEFFFSIGVISRHKQRAALAAIESLNSGRNHLELTG